MHIEVVSVSDLPGIFVYFPNKDTKIFVLDQDIKHILTSSYLIKLWLHGFLLKGRYS